MEITKRLDRGETETTTDMRTILEARDLASGVAVCIYDPASKIGGMAHVFVPSRDPSDVNAPAGVFADAGVDHLLNEMIEQGAQVTTCEVALVGGARFLAGSVASRVAGLGDRNVQAAEAALSSRGVRIKVRETGGSRNRHVRLRVADGSVTVEEP